MADRYTNNPKKGKAGQSFSSADFERLCKNIDSTVSQMSDILGKTFGEAGQEIGQSIGHAARKGAKGISRMAQKASDSRSARKGDTYAPPSGNPYQISRTISPKYEIKKFKSASGLSVSGALMTTGGGFLTFSFGLSAIVSLLAPSALTAGLDYSMGAALTTASGISCIAFTGLSAWLMGAGISRMSLSGKLKSIRRIMCGRDVCSFDELSRQMHLPKKKVVAVARKLIKRGLIPEGHIDDEQTCLMITNDTYALYRKAQREYLRRMKMERAQLDQEAMRAAADKDLENSLPNEAIEFIRSGKEYISRMRSLDDDIADEAVSAKIVGIEDAVSRILDRVAEQPDVLDVLSNMSTYYLPTTIRLLEAYDELEEQPMQLGEIAASRQEIEHTLDVLHDAYEKLLGETFREMTMDVTSDITVLHAVLAQDGLEESPFDVSAKHAAPDRKDCR